jgi:hypothetical protein
MIFSFNNNGNDRPLQLQQLDVLHDILHGGLSSGNSTEKEYSVLPLRNIPIEMEDAPIHDGVHPCGEIGCPCENGYGVSSLYGSREP